MQRAAFAILLLTSAARAQPEIIFGQGRPPVFHEEELDRRFLRSRISRALSQGTQDPSCAAVLAGLFTVVAEAAPYIHKRDANLYIDENLWSAANSDLSGSRFNAQRHIHAMLRRILLDRKLPPEWLAVAETVNGQSIIDMGKLRFLAEGVQPIDSFLFTIPLLQQRFDEEVTKANSLASRTALANFRDNYLDRDVTWGELTLVDVAAEKSGPRRKGGPPLYRAIARYQKVEPAHDLVDRYLGKRQVDVVTIRARLQETQYAPIEKITKGARVLLRGRFWDMNASLTDLELRDAILFQDRDWGQGIPFPGPSVVDQCPAALNELNGTGVPQPGGFARPVR